MFAIRNFQDLLFELLSSRAKDERQGTFVVSILRNVTDLARAKEEIEAIERVVFAHAVRSLEANDFEAARHAAERRLALGEWAADPGTAWGSRWRAVLAIAHLRTEIERTKVPTSPTGLLFWYAETGWRVDRTFGLPFNR